jgi:hypothetical protein
LKYWILLFLFCQQAQASLPEFFAGAASTMAIGNQSNGDAEDAANNFFVPALLAGSDKTAYSFNLYSLGTNFNTINNIVVGNELNSASSTPTYGDIDPNGQTSNFMTFHGALKLFKQGHGKLLFSVYAPVDKMIEANTGDAWAPEYVMYTSRFQRTMIHGHFANQWSSSLYYSIGFTSGLQSSGETYVVARETGTPYEPSSGKIQFNATPSLAPVISVLKKWNDNQASYLTYQAEMKSNFENNATGFTPIGASSLKYDWDFKAMLFYDPAIIRVGHWYHQKNWKYYATVEFQQWENYQTPKLEMVNNGGILTGSTDYEKMELDNIFIPKIGASYDFGGQSISFGYFSRPTPLKNNLDLAGNSLDSNTQVVSLGYHTPLKLMGNQFNFSFGTQFHQLEERKINKTSNMEDGNSGLKVGAPGYKVGGSVFVVSFGLNWVL